MSISSEDIDYRKYCMDEFKRIQEAQNIHLLSEFYDYLYDHLHLMQKGEKEFLIKTFIK